MPNFDETNTFPQAISIIEQNDLVLGGSETSGPNKLAKPLADRTRWLFNKVTELEAIVSASGTGLLDRFYPVGTIYSNQTNSANPSTYLGGGTWIALEGRVVVGRKAGDPRFGAAGALGGVESVTLSSAQMPSHAHGVNDPGHAHGYIGVEGFLDGGLAGYAVNNNDARNIGRVTDGAGTGISIQATGGNATHENMPPYVVVHTWRRTA